MTNYDDYNDYNDYVIEAFKDLYPKKELNRTYSIKYSGKFSPYNANVYITSGHLEFRLSSKWKTVTKSIQLGLIQSLFKKIYKTNSTTLNLDLYNLFIRNLEKVAPKTKYDPVLAQSFQRNNDKYFFGMLSMPNLKWGRDSIRKLGSYDFHTDTITISSIFMPEKKELLDYVMYHEMLHKKLKYKQSNTRSLHHSKEFKEKEKEFYNSKEIERELSILCSSKRIKKQVYSPYKRLTNALFGYKKR